MAKTTVATKVATSSISTSSPTLLDKLLAVDPALTAQVAVYAANAASTVLTVASATFDEVVYCSKIGKLSFLKLQEEAEIQRQYEKSEKERLLALFESI
jgi:hypothetical protein